MSPLLDRRTTLKDALSLLIDSDVQTGIVVDRDGRLRGVVTVDSISQATRDGSPADVRDAHRRAGSSDRAASAQPSEREVGVP
jgi:CBS domain-containing protein